MRIVELAPRWIRRNNLLEGDKLGCYFENPTNSSVLIGVSFEAGVTFPPDVILADGILSPVNLANFDVITIDGLINVPGQWTGRISDGEVF